MPRPFVPPDTPRRYARDCPVQVAHLHLDCELDFATRAIEGAATLRLRVITDRLSRVVLDAVELSIAAVEVDGRPLPQWHHDGERLELPLPATRARDDELTVRIAYRATPRRGLYFVGPDANAPDRSPQCWTQGQDEDARCYMPCIDAPAAKAPSEIVCTAPEGLHVLSNGELLGKAAAGPGKTRWHYRLDAPHAAYLVTLVCGRFTELTAQAPESAVPLSYFAPAGREEDARRTLRRTPEMLDFFARRTGIPYPFGRYSQIFVADFPFGGMENTSATTLTDQALLDARAALDHDVEPLIAHELAHQWWGNLVTCREWSEAWLNEGFATYFEYLWAEHAHGRDEADMLAVEQVDAYLDEADEYQRPILCRQWREPIELFDGHLYEKGGRVLHLLRAQAGEEPFFAALRRYAERHRHGSAATADLARAFEEATGRNWDRFFDDWVGQPGHPELSGTWDWDEERRLGVLQITQTGTPRAFELKLALGHGDALTERRMRVESSSHRFAFELPERPDLVVLDPGNDVLKTCKLELSLPLWTRQLERGRHAVDRIVAARALGERHEPAARDALVGALARDPFWGVRAEAARALGRHGTAAARDALLAALGDPRTSSHPRVRRGIADALGAFVEDARAAAALTDWLERGDPSYFAEAAAARALGRTRDPRAVALAPALLARPAFQDVIRARALEGLGDSGREDALDVVLGTCARPASYQVRRAAADALGKLGQGSPRARDARAALERLLRDPSHAVRARAARALARLAEPAALPALELARARELDGRARRALDEAMADLRTGRGPTEELRKLREQVESLRAEQQHLRERLDVVEARGALPAPGAPPAAPPGAPRARPAPASTTRRRGREHGPRRSS